MSNPFKSLLRLLKDNSVNKIEVSASPPFAKMTFDKSELQALTQGKSRISELVAICFVRRRVFWEDIRKENRDAVVESMKQVERELNDHSGKLVMASDDAVLGLAKFVRAWATASTLVRKTLEDRLREIDDEKASVLGYDWANEDRDSAMNDALVSLRQRVYPLVTLLVAFLDDNDPTKAEAQLHLDSGLNLIPDAALQRGCIPDVEEIDA